MKGKHIYVLGAGGSGVAAARLARQLGADVRLVDSGDTPRLRELRDQLASEGIVMETGWQPSADSIVCDECIVSPGVPVDSLMMKFFSSSGCAVCSELEFGGRYCPWPKLAITGTNGKTTVVEMLTHCLQQSGRHVEAGGNIGLPLADVALRRPELDVLVVEVSSYQLETTKAFTTAGAALLNITPDHLSRHGTMENYRNLKLSLLRQVSDSGICVLRSNLLDDPVIREAVAGKKTLTFSSERTAVGTADYFVADGFLVRRCGASRERLLSIDRLPFDGAHNYENCLAVLAMGEALSIPPCELAPSLCSFRIGPHRMEIVWEHDGIRYVNDSKATNLDALVQSLRKFDTGRSEIALIAGGVLKGCDLSPVLSEMRGRVSGVFLIGESREELKAKWGGTVPCVCCGDLREAFEGACSCVSAGGTVLLSPGCASQDMFKDYIERGNRFVELVSELRREKD